MKTNKLQCNTAREIPIVDFLKTNGFSPKRENDKEAWFLSPIRKEHDASFKVSKSLNRWYDHGAGIGGNIIDLVIEMNNNCSVHEALVILSKNVTHFSSRQPVFSPVLNVQSEMQIEKIVSLRHPALLNYLQSRKINPDRISKYAKQVHYSLNGNNFFAIGMENISGGWELRNPYYKNSVSPKDFSLLSRSSNNLCITEGMFDFFSLLMLKPDLAKKSDFIILNSLSFIDRIKKSAQNYSKVRLYLDNDRAGKNATIKLTADLNNCVDMSAIYSPKKDLNEMLMASNHRQRRSVR